MIGGPRLACALFCLALSGCDDAPVEPAPLPVDAQPDAPVASDRGADGSTPVDARPIDATLDRGRLPAADGAVDTALDGGADAADAAADGAADSALDASGDSAADAASDALLDAAPDLAPDMPWAPAEHRVFMTAQAYDADFGGIEGADDACAAAATAAGLAGTWKAIISDAEVGARDRLVIIGPIETTAGERVARDADDLWDGAIRVPIAVDARGMPPGGRPDVWSGTDADGSPDARANSFCSDWGRADRPLGGVETGRGDLVDARWIAFYRDGASAYNCGSQARLYCIDGQ